MESIRILGTGSYLPQKVLTNYDLTESGLDTTHEWIVQRTGVSERRVADADVATSDLAYEASLKALDMAGKKVLIFDGLYAALIGDIKTSGSRAARIIAMNEKRFNLDAQKERGKEKVNEHRLKVLERECNAVRSLWPYVTHKITEDWEVVPYVHAT